MIVAMQPKPTDEGWPATMAQHGWTTTSGGLFLHSRRALSVAGSIAAVAACVAWALAPAPAVARPDCHPARFDILTPPFASTLYIVLDAGGRKAPWLLDFGSTITSVYQDAWKAEVGDIVEISGLPLPGAVPGPRRLPVVAGGRPRAGVGSPLGTLGTDVLRRMTVEIHLYAALMK